MSELPVPQSEPNVRPVSRQDQKQQTKSRLIEAAIELFNNNGYQETTIDQIVRRAGTSRPTFYAYFRDKTDLANAIGATLAPLVVPLYAQIDTTSPPTKADVRLWLDAMVGFCREHAASIEAAADATINAAQANSYFSDLGMRHADLCMPNYLARFDGAARDSARARLLLLNLQLERFLFVTTIRDVAFPLPNVFDSLAELWWNTLFRDLPPT